MLFVGTDVLRGSSTLAVSCGTVRKLWTPVSKTGKLERLFSAWASSERLVAWGDGFEVGGGGIC